MPNGKLSRPAARTLNGSVYVPAEIAATASTLIGSEFGEAMRELGAARVAEHQHPSSDREAGDLRQLVEVVGQRADQFGIFARDLGRVLVQSP